MNLQLANKLSTTYCVVVDDNAIPSERYAAEECAHFLSEITGAYFPIVNPSQVNRYENSIIIGHGSEAERHGVIPNSELGCEGYEIKVSGRTLVIAGGQPRGTLYGVYALLEEDLGCRWYTPNFRHIPKRDTLVLGNISRTHKPLLEYREVFYGNAFDGDWNARNRLNGANDQLYSKHGGKITYCNGFVHTFDRLLPFDEYFDSHPEYFSLVNGKRLGEKSQLCLTNPDVLTIVKKNVRTWLKENAEATIISVSQNDYYNPCECENCKRIDEKEGSHAGSLIWFVNQIAQDLETDYPNIIVDTLAYQYTRPAPKHIRPRPNVCVRLCSIECCFGHPLEHCAVIAPPYQDKVIPGASFQKDLMDWGKICDRVYIWDYVTNFNHYCMPFPNLDVLQPNIRFLTKNSVKGIFEQGNYACGGGPDFNELRTWLLAKLLWNPDCDVIKARAEFMQSYYGKSAPALDQYLELIHKKVRDEDIHFGIFSQPDVTYISDDMLTQINGFFDEAERMADNDEVLWRVQRARMSIRYISMARRIAVDEPDMAEVDTYLAHMERYGLSRISEWLTKEEERKRIIATTNSRT